MILLLVLAGAMNASHLIASDVRYSVRVGMTVEQVERILKEDTPGFVQTGPYVLPRGRTEYRRSKLIVWYASNDTVLDLRWRE